MRTGVITFQTAGSLEPFLVSVPESMDEMRLGVNRLLPPVAMLFAASVRSTGCIAMPEQLTLTMRETPFPLDVVWMEVIGGSPGIVQGRVVKVERNVAARDPIPHVSPPGAFYALELSAGRAERIREGSFVTLMVEGQRAMSTIVAQRRQ